MEDRQPSLRAVLCLLAAFTLGAAIQLQDGEFSPAAITLVGVTVGLCAAASACGSRCLESMRRVVLTCFACLAAQLVCLIAAPVGGHQAWSNDLSDAGFGEAWFFKLEVGASGLLLLAAMVGPTVCRRVAIVVMLAVHLSLGVWLISRSPSPHIDTYVIQKEASAAMRAGKNPYAITTPDIYRSTEPGQRRVYGEGMSKDGMLQFGYIYPPISLLLGTSADFLFGDPRYAAALCATLAGAFIALVRTSRWSLLAAAMFLWTPRGFFVLGRGWNEAYVVLAAAFFAWAGLRRPKSTPLALGLLLGVKQYLVFLTLPAALLHSTRGWRRRARFLGLGLLVAAVTILPWFLWDPRAFCRSVVYVQFAGPAREDALTFFTAAFKLTGHWPATWLCLIPVAVAGGLVYARGERSFAGFLAGGALLLLVFFAFNKQAFANYYYGVIGMLCCAAALDQPGDPKENAQGPLSLGVEGLHGTR